jgi:sec-independent protein translocase protein TatC
VITSPVILYHLWQFVRPGLKPHEQRSALLYIPVMIALFLGGLFFGYFIVFPYMMEFVATLNKLMGIGAMYSVADAFDFLFNILLPLAFLFELPVVVLFLTRIRLITPALLIKGRRIAYFLLVVLAAMISPPDLTSNLIILIPLILIYEISVWISYLQYQRMLREEENGGV